MFQEHEKMNSSSSLAYRINIRVRSLSMIIFEIKNIVRVKTC